MLTRELPNEGREPSIRADFKIHTRARPYTTWDLIDDLRELADSGFGDYEPDISTMVLRPHVETPQEAATRKLNEAQAELNAERAGRRRKPTRTNPTGSVIQCDRKSVHDPHEYQGEFGAYFSVYCPGNTGQESGL